MLLLAVQLQQLTAVGLRNATTSSADETQSLSPQPPPTPTTTVTADPLRLATEGLTTVSFVSTTPVFNVTAPPLCVIAPYQWGTNFGAVPQRSGSAGEGEEEEEEEEEEEVQRPWIWNGSLTSPRGRGATTKLIFQAVVLDSMHAHCRAPAVSAEGPGRLSITALPSLSWNVSFFVQWDVAVGLRPYINESEGHILLRADEYTSTSGQPLLVEASLPFGNHSWSWRTSGASECILPFDLRPLPLRINQDLKITVRASTNTSMTTTSYRRLMRAPPPSTDVGAVQVDHFTRGLRINGRPWNGVGFFLWSDFMQPANLRNFSAKMPGLVDAGFNLIFMYGLNGVGRPFWNSSYDLQLEFLDNCSAAGMKVIYPPDWGHMNPMGGHGTKGSCTSPLACANKSLVNDLVKNLTVVMRHSAILGYYSESDNALRYALLSA